MKRQHGFTLVELVVVIVLGGIVAATLAVFFRPAFESYLAARSRAELVDQADTALRRMVRDVRSAVPNSIRTPAAQCFELVPTTMGGRLRMGPDTVNDAVAGCAPAADCSAPLDTTRETTTLDVLSALPATPAVGDWLVIGNQNPNDVYAGVNRAALAGVATPRASDGRQRLSVATTQFPLGYDGGRFVIVPAAQRAVFYVCSGADGTLDARGHGKGTLVRLANYGFNGAYPAACPDIAGADVLASHVRSCRFVYNPNQGATQQNGFVWMQLELAVRGETAHLAIGAHVANVP
jgi:MSHA biogenesis protein MshO